MDSLSQFLMGAVVGQIVLGPKNKGKGALLGGIAGTLPDLDVIPLMGSSIIAQLVHHRGVSHSLILCFGLPVVLAWASQRWLNASLSFRRWWMFWMLAFLTHVWLDVMTTWGTQVFWPHPARITLDSLFIIDPLLTIPLFIGCLVSWWQKTRRGAVLGVMMSSLYMIFALSAHAWMDSRFKQVFENNNIQVTQQLVRPTPFNTLYWAVTARTPTDKLIMGYARLWDNVEDIQLSRPVNQRSDLLSPIQHNTDVKTLLDVTKGYYVIDSSPDQVMIRDARFGRLGGWMMTPDSRFVFNYVYNVNQNTWSQYRPPMPDAMVMLASLWQKIWD